MIEKIREIWPDLRIGSEIGRGQLSIVYEVFSKSDDGQTEAVKVISFKGHAQLLKTVVNDLNFMRELAESGAVVKISDFKAFGYPDGSGFDIYVRMEKLKPLNQIIKQQRFDDVHIIKLAQDILDNLQKFDDRGAVHLNIKPSNILQDGTGRYKLGDLHSIRYFEAIEREGIIPELQDYMAPEILTGKDIDIRADLYSLGCVIKKIMQKSESDKFEQLLMVACDEDPKNRFVKPMVMKHAVSYIEIETQNRMNSQSGQQRQHLQGQQLPIQKKRSSIPIIGVVAAACVVIIVAASIFIIGKLNRQGDENVSASLKDAVPIASGGQDDENGTLDENAESTDILNDGKADNTISKQNVDISDVRIDFDYNQGNTIEQAVVTAYMNNQTAWTYTTDAYEPAQCRRITEIGSFDYDGGAYYIVENGAVICFDLYTGNIRWKNEDYRGSLPSKEGALLYSDGNLYLCGSLGPDLFVVSAATGETINRINDYDAQYLWPFKLTSSEDYIEITFESGPSGEKDVLYYSIRDGGISQQKNTSENSNSNGENTEIVIDQSAVKSVSASSYLEEPQYGLIHDASCIIDGDTSTAWVENVNGQGEGEWIKIDLYEQHKISGFEIYNGHQESYDLYQKNSRIHELRVTGSDGVQQTFTLTDDFGKQTITFDTPVETDSLIFTIVSVYSGSKYEDTCIAEIQLKEQ